ncbi:MAG: hypothetical protein WAP52_01665, partial [Candidatus Sungiibacteriota bacterium]
MHISIHSLQSTLFDGEAEKLICETPMGQMTVLDHHLPLISRVNGPSLVVVQKNGERAEVLLAGGFLEVRPNSEVIVLAQYSLTPLIRANKGCK